MEQLAQTYEELDESMKTLMKSVKETKEQRDQFGQKLQQEMMNKNISDIVLPSGNVLMLKTRVQLGAINKEYIQETLTDFFKQPLPKDNTELAQRTADALLNNREAAEKMSIKLQKKK